MLCKGKLLELNKPVVMGIINLSPDSFYEGSRVLERDTVLKVAENMLREGAAIIDIGAQSTRPGSERLDEEEELSRLAGAIENLTKRFPDIILSVDTYLPKIARYSIQAGAAIVNDISGGGETDEMFETVGDLGVPYICMHLRGTPKTMHVLRPYEDIGKEVLDYFIRKIDQCKKAGIHDVILDPGFGFSKTIEDNFQLLRDLPLFSILEKPVLVGVSRKSTIYKTLGVTAKEALNGSTVLHTIALLHGANILRVHDVKEAVEAIRMVESYVQRG